MSHQRNKSVCSIRTTHPRSHLSRLTATLLTLITLASLAVFGAPMANAASGYSISAGTWNVRACPATCGVVGTISQGGIPNLVCQVSGPTVSASGFGSSSVYDLVKTPSGVLGYISDLGVSETPYAAFDPRLPRCEATTSQSSSVAPAATGTGYGWIPSCAYQVYNGKLWACWWSGVKWLFTPTPAS